MPLAENWLKDWGRDKGMRRMDKIKFQKKQIYKLFGIKIFEIDTQFEECDLDNIPVTDEALTLPIKFNS